MDKQQAFQDRIKELRRVKASEIQANPQNWRLHTEQQTNAVRGILEDVGFASALICYEKDGQLELIDGHLRQDIAPDQEVPVLVLDVDEVEAKKLLVSFDPLGAMAEMDQAKLRELLTELESAGQLEGWIKDDEGLGVLLQELSTESGFGDLPEFEPATLDDQSQLDAKNPVKCPHCGEEFTPP